MKNYYNILEVNENASIEVIEKAYKVLVKKYHPDLQGDTLAANKKIKEINEAYNVLSDSFLKEQYDEELQKEKEKNKISSNNNLQESDYSRLYREKERLKYQLAHEKYEKDRIKTKTLSEQEQEPNNSSEGIISLIKTLFRCRPTMESIKNIKRIDVLALILTVIVVLGIGLILYWLPFTHDWMNRNFVDTPLVNWFRNLF